MTQREAERGHSLPRNRKAPLDTLMGKGSAEGSGRGAGLGQVWARHFAPTAPAFTQPSGLLNQGREEHQLAATALQDLHKVKG